MPDRPQPAFPGGPVAGPPDKAAPLSPGRAMRKAIGTAAAIGFPNAVTGCIGYLINGWGAAHLPPYSLGYVYLPALLGIVAVSMIAAPLGARLAQRLPVPKLKRCFAVLLIAVGLKMLYSAVF